MWASPSIRSEAWSCHHFEERGPIVDSARSRAGLGDIAAKRSQRNFCGDDLRGSTFTISNLGAIGGTYSTPIINTPEVAILLVGRSRKLPVVVDDEVAIRLMMPMSFRTTIASSMGSAAAVS